MKKRLVFDKLPRVTPYTPKHTSRYFYGVAESELAKFPEEIRNMAANTEIKAIVCGRKCTISRWQHGTIVITVEDEGLPTKIEKKSEKEADLVFMAFCRSDKLGKNWTNLFWSWSRTGRMYFHKRLIERLENIDMTRSCEKCKMRFKCYTEK